MVITKKSEKRGVSLPSKRDLRGTSLVIWWLKLCVPNARGLGLIPGQGTGSQRRVCMPQLRPRAVKLKKEGWGREIHLRDINQM